MRRNNTLLCLVAVLAAGCHHAVNVVFVDVDRILIQEKLPEPPAVTLPNPPATDSTIVKIVPGSPARTLKDPANTPHLNVAEMFRADQARALIELQRRLRQFYNS